MHRLGVFYDGMDTYGYAAATNITRTPDTNGLSGTATYKGSAAGYYVNGLTDSGVFTADANLTATL